MGDTINRDEAIKAINKALDRETILNRLVRKVVLDAIISVPSADRPQGEWIYCEDEYGIDGYRCSNCGRHIPWDYQHKFINFIDDYHTCPFCDARMKGAENEVVR